MPDIETSPVEDDKAAVEFDDLPSEDEVDAVDQDRFREAVLHSTDWTTETIVSQLERGNILLNPSFQRRDAWKPQQKSRFIESLILGLPIPQIVLAESRERRGKFIVLDGKQRLLAILQFWGLGEGRNNNYALSGLDIRADLTRKRLANFEADGDLEDDFNALLNQPIRTVVIKNWPSVDFLHLVFLRLNTGSVKLSPQELRQALFPGPFSDWIDTAAMNSEGIKSLLHLTEPDFRMRDIEVLSRYFAFRFLIEGYQGRMKKFLDFSFSTFNDSWSDWEPKLQEGLGEFEAAITPLKSIFGESVGKKPDSKQFNRAVFDFLVFYAQDPSIRQKMELHSERVRLAFVRAFEDSEFRSATERDTAGIPNTAKRLSMWGTALSEAIETPLPIPKVVDDSETQRVSFSGF